MQQQYDEVYMMSRSKWWMCCCRDAVDDECCKLDISLAEGVLQ